MGCSVCTRKKSTYKAVRNTVCCNSSSYSIKTLVESVEIASKTHILKKSCQKSQVVQDDGAEILKNYHLLVNLGINACEEYKLVSELISTYNYYYSLFKESVHGSCIQDFTLSKGVLIALLHISISQKNPTILFSPLPHFPYFSFAKPNHEPLHILNNLFYFMRTVKSSQDFHSSLLHIDYIIKSLEILNIFSDFPEYIEGFSILTSTFESCKSLQAAVQLAQRDLKNCCFGYFDSESNLENFNQVFYVLKDFEQISTCNIVHFLQSELNETGLRLN